MAHQLHKGARRCAHRQMRRCFKASLIATFGCRCRRPTNHATCHRVPHHKRASATNHCHVAEAAPSHKVATATQRAAARMTVASLQASRVGGRKALQPPTQHHSTTAPSHTHHSHGPQPHRRSAATSQQLNPARKVMLTALWALGFRWGGCGVDASLMKFADR